MNRQRVIDELIRRQGSAGWSDREMGRQIGVAHTTWLGIKTGEHGAGAIFLERALRRFPDLVVYFFSPTDVTDTNTNVGGERAEVA